MRPDLGPTCLQRLPAKDKKLTLARKELSRSQIISHNIDDTFSENVFRSEKNKRNSNLLEILWF